MYYSRYVEGGGNALLHFYGKTRWFFRQVGRVRTALSDSRYESLSLRVLYYMSGKNTAGVVHLRVICHKGAR